MFNTAESIVQNVRIADNNIKFADSLGSFVQNAEFSKGFVKFLNSDDDASAYVWKALSAIGQDVNSIVYSNVLNYIDAVSNIDTCKLKSLKSMMKLVGSSYDIFGNIDMLPIEVVQLLDVLSISKKYLLDSSKFKQALVDDEEPLISAEYGSAEDQMLWKYQYLRNAFVLSADDLPPCQNSIFGEYVLEDDFAYSYSDGPSYLEKHQRIPFEDAQLLDNFNVIGKYDNAEISGLVCRRYESGKGWQILKYYKYGEVDEELYSIVSKNGIIAYTFSADEFEDSVDQSKNFELLKNIDGYIQYVPEQTNLKSDFISEDKYYDYIKNIYNNMLSSFVTMKYNTLKDGIQPIYCYLKDEYYKTNAYYEAVDNTAGSRRRFKSKNNIPLTFDEKKIVDDIDNGTDALDNYFGAELELLDLEIQDRAKTLSFSIVDASYSADSSSGTIEKYTRYSYYRKAKVLEYMKFIDNQYYSGLSYLKTSDIYEFDNNYYEVEKRQADDCHVLDENFEFEKDYDYSKDYKGIHFEVIDEVAKNLAQFTLYIQKLREKVRLQTRKNYMKGTNNLIRYVINEYLVDFARNSQLFKDTELSKYLVDIKRELSSNDVDNVEVVEYYDTTEYYNIDTATTPNAQNSNTVNGRYWENAISKDLSGKYFARDGIDIPSNEISNFYYNTMKLKTELSDASSNMYEFLSTIFDIGATTSYVAKDGMFVTKLSSGQYSDEIYEKYLKLSADFDQLAEYSDGYAFNTSQSAREQLSGLVQHLASQLSSSYFSDVSANYQQYMPDAEQISAQIEELSAHYNDALDQYAIYLSKSSSKYSYTGNDPVHGKYKHDYFIGNDDVYNATMLLDKLGDLRSFAADENNMHVWAFSDNLADMNAQFVSLSAYINEIRALIYSSKMSFEDIDSQYIDEELQFMQDVVTSARDNRRQELEDAISTSKGVVAEQYSGSISYFDQLADEYKQIENEYASIIANYRSKYVNQFGDSTFKYILKAERPENASFVNVTYKTMQINQLEDAELIEDKCKNAISWMTQNISWNGDLPEQTEQVETQANGQDEVVIQFGSNYNIPDSPYLLADPGIQASLQQLINRVDGIKKSAANHAEVLKPLNNSVKAAYDSIESGNLYPGDIVIQDVDEANASVMCKEYSNQLKMQQIGTQLSIDGLRSHMLNDTFFSQCTTILGKLTRAVGMNEQLQTQYTAFLNEKDIIEYLDTYQAQDKFTANAYDSLYAFSQTADDASRRSLLNDIDQMYNQYYSAQDQYVKLMQILKQQLPRYYYANNYIEQDLHNVISSLEDDVAYNIDLAKIKLNAKLAQLHDSIDGLSAEISASIDLSGSTILQLFQLEIQRNDIYSDPQYLASMEMFYQYSGLSSGQAPFFNYKNVAHSTRQLHDFFWNFIEADKYIEIAKSSFDSIYVDQLENELAVKNIDKFIGKNGQLIDIWKHNVQDYTGYSTRYIDSSHLMQNYIGKFEVADYDGAFYPPAIEMFRKDPVACIDSLSAQFSTVDSVNAFISDDSVAEDLDIYTTQEFFSMAWNSLRGNEYSKYVPDGNLAKIILAFISENSMPGVGYDGQAVDWMTSTKTEFAKYILDNIDKSFFERFYYPLGLSKENYAFIAEQLKCDEVQKQIIEITNAHDRKDLYDIYKYGFDTYGNIYVLYKQYGQEKPSYQTKLNTLGKMWIRLNNHPIAIPLVLKSQPNLAPVDVASANQYIRTIYEDNDDLWCYDFNFSDNKRLICFSCRNKASDLPEYFKNKYKYSWQAVAIVSQKTNIDLNRSVLKISNQDDVPDDIIVQPYMKSIEMPTAENDTYAYQFIGTYAPSLYSINAVYVKTNYHLANDSIEPYLDCPPQVVVLKASNESMNIEIQNQLSVVFDETQFINSSNNNIFSFDNDQAVFSYNFSSKLLTFAFLGSLDIEDASEKYKYEVPLNKEGELDIYNNSNGQMANDPVAAEMSSHDMFTDNIIVVNAKPAALAAEQVGSLKMYNTNADASYLPLYPGSELESLVDKLQLAGKSYYSFELLGHSKNIDKWIARANPYADITMPLSTIIDEKVNGRIYELHEDEYADLPHDEQLEKFKELYLSCTAAEQYNPLMRQSSDLYYNEDVDAYLWSIDIDEDTQLKYSKPEDIYVILYNVDLHGKNPYYVCKLQDLLPSRNPAGKKPAAYNTEKSEYSSSDVKSDVFNANASCKAMSTQPYAQLNSTDNNHIDGIAGISAWFECSDDEKVLNFEFQIDAQQSEESEKENFIPAKQLRLLLFNPTYLEAFNKYHLFDIYGVIFVNDLNNPIVDKVGENWYISYGKERFSIGPYYIDKKGHKHALSSIDFNDQNALSDTYIVQSYDKLNFKYDEQMIYDITSDMYYYPSVNVKYPYTPGTYLQDSGYVQQFDGSMLDDVFDESNYYVFRIDDPTSMANKIGNVSIGIEAREAEVWMAFEDYISEEADTYYDYEDPRNLKYLQFIADEAGYNELTSIDIDEDEVAQCDDIQSAIELVHTAGIETAFPNEQLNYVGKQSRVPQVTFKANSRSVDLNDALKIYASYKKEEDQSITLYFNYMNYLDSPFVKIVNGKTAIDVIDGTYLKLEAGEEGQLDVVVQFKYYSKGIVYGVTNVVVATYKIFNLSDDKPKFLIYKQSTVKKDQYEYVDTKAYVQLKVVSNGSMTRNDLDVIDGEYYAIVEVDADFDNISLYESNTFSLQYNSALLKYSECISDGCTVNSLQPGVLKIATYKPDVKKFAFMFLVKNADNILKHDSIEADFSIDDVQYYYAGYEQVKNVKTINGKIVIEKDEAQ